MRAYAPVRTVAPASRIIDLAGAKAHLRVTSTAEDALIEGLILAAESLLDGPDGLLDRALLTQTWTQSFDEFPTCDRLRLSVRPVQSISSVTYFDSDGASQTFANFELIEDPIGPALLLNNEASWPSTATRPDAVTVTIVAGFGDELVGSLDRITQAAKLLIGLWFDSRAAASDRQMTEMPFAVQALLGGHRPPPL